MPTSLGRIEPIAGPRRPPADEDLPSPEVLRELHRTYVLGKQRTFLAAAPFGLLGTFALVAAARDPQIFGGLLFPAFIGVVAVGRVGYEWLTLRHADPVAVYLREQRESEIVSAQRAEHQARLSEIRPMATIFVTACILAVTAVEFARLASAPVSEVIARAALVKPAVRAGEWWRLLTATYLHGSLVHIAANASALFALGQIVETYEGRLRVPLAYCAGAILGSIVSTLASTRTSVGASGGVMALAAYLLVVAGRTGTGGTPAWLRRGMLSIIGWTAALGIAAFVLIDNAAHLGGALGGALAALAAGAAERRRRDVLDALGIVAIAILGAGAVLTIWLLVR